MKRLLISAMSLLTLTGAVAYRPGGVDGAAAWFRTERHTTDWGTRYRWKDLSGAGNTLRHGNSEVSYSSNNTRLINFNPAMPVPSDHNHAWISGSDLSQCTVIGVFSPSLWSENGKNKSDSRRVIYSIQDGEGSHGVILNDTVIETFTTGTRSYMGYGDRRNNLRHESGEEVGPFNEDRTKVLTFFKASRPVTDVWGIGDGMLTLGEVWTEAGTNWTATGHGYDQFSGYCPELLVFPRILTPMERLRAESYLAMRYGVTLRGSYLGPDGALLWDAHALGGYHHRVTAIGRDDGGAFSQTRSATIHRPYGLDSNNGSVNGIANSHFLTIGKEPGSDLPDGTWIVWGDNGGTTSLSLQGDDRDEDDEWYFMERTWTLRKSHSVQTANDGSDPEEAPAAGTDEKCYVALLDNGFNLEDKIMHRIYLCIDRSGSGDFTPGAMETVRCSARDAAHSKTMFRDVEWDTDGNGTDMFTFAVHDAFRAHVEAFQSGCGATGPQGDGSVTLYIDDGLPEFGYALTRADTGSNTEATDTVSAGTFTDSVKEMTGMRPGMYLLSVTQKGGIKERTLHYEIEIGSECDLTTRTSVREVKAPGAGHDAARSPGRSRGGSDESGTGQEMTADRMETFSTVPVQGERLTFESTLTLDAETPATLAVYDTAGKLQYSAEMTGGTQKTARFTVPATGVYVVKAFTPDDEHTCKIMAR